MMRKPWRSRWFTTGIGVAAAGLMVIVFGPFVGPLSGIMPRAAAVLALTGLWAAANAAVDRMRRRRDQVLSSGVASSGVASSGIAGRTDTTDRQDVPELRDKLQRAMALLRQSGGARGYLYQQPWYVIIGPPGAGKTTALANAGLRFPLAAALGADEVRGVGGTRLCDWSFTDEAVLIDTAGRYTTQDSDAARDRAGWEGFLDLLRGTRARQPLNGVIVAIGLDDIAAASEAGRHAHARAIRSRLRELDARLGVRLPVYAIFTKADLIQGFEDFFADLDRAGRSQVWGVTFPPGAGRDPGTGNDVGERFQTAFRALVAQLSGRLADRLQAEHSLSQRAMAIGFPTQVASLEAPLRSFVEEAFGGTRLDPAPFLRGAYLASATQQGSAIDRLTHALAAGFGLDPQRIQPAGFRQGRGYFLDRLFKTVIFGEAMLVSQNPGAIRRQRLGRMTAWGGLGLCMAAGAIALGASARESHRATLRAAAALSAYQQAYATLTGEENLASVPIGGADLPQILPVLDRAREVEDAAAADRAWLGLSQRRKLGGAAGRLYGRTLQYMLLPRLVSLAEARLRAHAADPAFLYRVALPYKMLCGLLPPDPGRLHGWLEQDLAASFAGSSNADRRSRILAHADRLFTRDPAVFPPMMDAVDGDSHLIGSAEAQMGNLSVADIAYAQIRAAPQPADLRDFIPGRAGGTLTRSYFIRRDGAGLDKPVPGFFTPDGFRRAFQPHLPAAIDRAMRESAARGPDAAMNSEDPAARLQVEREVTRHYTNEYVAEWQGLLDQLDIVPPRDSGAAVGEFQQLTSATGPLTRLLNEVVDKTTLSRPAPADAPPTDIDLGGAAVDRAFQELHGYVVGGDLQSHLKALGGVEARIEETLGGAASGGTLPARGGAPLADIAQGAPEPVHRWLVALATGGQAAQSATSRAAIAQAFHSSDGPQPQCRRVTAAFPFRAHTAQDAPLEDFKALFGLDGAMDGFFNRYLRAYVTTAPGSGPWRVHPAGGLRPPIDDAAAQALQNAAAIRDAFFSYGIAPSVRFSLTPVDFDTGTRKVTVTSNGMRQEYDPAGGRSGPPMEWPGVMAASGASVVFDPPGDGPALEQPGRWAWFRLVRQAQQAPIGDHAIRITFQQGERRATFDLGTGAVRNPFRAGMLAGFACPSIQP